MMKAKPQEPRAAAPRQVESATAGQQERTRRLVEREHQESDKATESVAQLEEVATKLSEGGALDEGLENLARKPETPVISHDARTQAEKFEAAARELGCDPNEDRFKGVLRKLATRRPADP